MRPDQTNLPGGAIGRIGDLRFAHPINDMVFVSNSVLILAADSLLWWDIDSGKESQRHQVQSGGVNCLSISPSGQFLAYGSEDGAIGVIRASGGSVLHLRKYRSMGSATDDPANPWPMAVRDVQFTRHGHSLISAHWNGTVIFWDAKSGAELQLIAIPKHGLANAVLAPDADTLFAGFEDGSIVDMDLTSGEKKWLCQVHSGTISGLVLAAECLISTGYEDGMVCAWNASTGALLHRKRGPEPGISGLALSNDHTLIAISSAYGLIEIRSVDDLEVIRSITILGELGSLAFAPDDGRLASRVSSGIGVWSMSSSDTVFKGNGPAFIQDMSLAPSAHHVALAETETVGIWDIETSLQTRQLEASASRVSFCRDGRRLATAGYRQPVRVWDWERGRQLWSGPAQDWVRSLEFSPDGKYLATGDDDTLKGASIVLWDGATGVQRSVARSIAFPSPELAMEELQQELDKLWTATSLSFAPDGSVLASAGLGSWQGYDTIIRLWSVPDLSSVRCLRSNHGYSTAVCFAADRPIVAAACDSNRVIIWNTTASDPVAVVNGPASRIETLALSRDGRVLALGCEDGTLVVGYFEGGSIPKEVRAHSRRVAKVAFDPSKDILFSASTDATVLIWDVNDMLGG